MIQVSDELISDVASAVARLEGFKISSRHCCQRCAKLLLNQAIEHDRDINVIKAIDDAECFFCYGRATKFIRISRPGH